MRRRHVLGHPSEHPRGAHEGNAYYLFPNVNAGVLGKEEGAGPDGDVNPVTVPPPAFGYVAQCGALPSFRGVASPEVAVGQEGD